MTNDDPDEVIIVAYCSACENIELAGNVGDMEGKPCCPCCGTVLNADSFYDYCDMRVVDYGV